MASYSFSAEVSLSVVPSLGGAASPTSGVAASPFLGLAPSAGPFLAA
jgi:hypothetical protein